MQLINYLQCENIVGCNIYFHYETFVSTERYSYKSFAAVKMNAQIVANEILHTCNIGIKKKKLYISICS